jgi:hypothetical protein
MGRISRRDTAAITIMLRLMIMSHLLEVSCQAVVCLAVCVKVNPRRDPSVKSEELQIPSPKRGTCVEDMSLDWRKSLITYEQRWHVKKGIGTADIINLTIDVITTSTVQVQGRVLIVSHISLFKCTAFLSLSISHPRNSIPPNLF